MPVPDEPVVEAPDAEESETDGPRIVKSKRFAMYPMSAEEAAERMDLIGHGFFFFTPTRRPAGPRSCTDATTVTSG